MTEELVHLSPQPIRKFEVGWKIQAFHGKVRKARRAMGFSQKALAEIVGVSLPTIQHVENMTKRPPDSLRDQLADFLRLDKEDVWPNWLEELSEPLTATAYQECTQTEFSALGDRQKEKVAALTGRGDDEPERRAVAEDIKRGIDAVMKSLTYREREILKLRYGLHDGYVYTLVEVGRIFKITGIRVRRIEEKALRKLQHPVRMNSLKDSAEGVGIYFCMCGEALGIARFCHRCKKQGCGACMKRQTISGKYIWVCRPCAAYEEQKSQENQ